MQSTETSASPGLKLTTALALGLALTALSINAATMTFCEDEANGFYLCKLPLEQVLAMLGGGYHEDPPLSDVVLHGWVSVVGFRPWLLRGLPLAFWLAALPGLFLCGRRLFGPPGGWLTLLALAMMPYHWTMPGVFRWYSLYACLAAWNFWFFLGMDERSPWRMAGYVATGAALWYTNYSAPILFFAHLLVALGRGESRWSLVRRLVVCWIAVGVLYLPWLPTFLGQLGRSARPLSASYTAVSLWVLWAGELQSPLSIAAVVPAVAAGLLFLVLAAAHVRHGWMPLGVVGIVLAGLLASGAIGPKRLLIVSPFLALGLAAVLAGRSQRRPLALARTGLVAALLAMCAGSWVNLVRGSDWVAYRWLDPCDEVVRQIEPHRPGTLILSNSNPIFFYLEDEYGKNLCPGPQRTDPNYRPAALLYPLDLNHDPILDGAMADAERVVWIYHSPYHGPLSRHYDGMVEQLARHGFEVVRVEPYLRPSAGFLHHQRKVRGHQPGDADRRWDDYRIVAVYFQRSGERRRDDCQEYRVARRDK